MNFYESPRRVNDVSPICVCCTLIQATSVTKLQINFNMKTHRFRLLCMCVCFGLGRLSRGHSKIYRLGMKSIKGKMHNCRARNQYRLLLPTSICPTFCENVNLELWKTSHPNIFIISHTRCDHMSIARLWGCCTTYIFLRVLSSRLHEKFWNPNDNIATASTTTTTAHRIDGERDKMQRFNLCIHKWKRATEYNNNRQILNRDWRKAAAACTRQLHQL